MRQRTAARRARPRGRLRLLRQLASLFVGQGLVGLPLGFALGRRDLLGFLELQPGYWDVDSETRLREKIERERLQKIVRPM